MYYSKLFKALLALGAVVVTANGATIYPKSLQTQKGSNSDVSLSALATKDQKSTQDSWDKYIEFYGSSEAFQGVFTFDASDIDASSVGTYTLDVNFKGPVSTNQVWSFEFFDAATNTWIQAGDNSDAKSWKWTSLSFCGTNDFASLVADGNIQVRMTSTEGDDCDVDYLAITTKDGAPSGTTDSSSHEEPTAAPTQAARPTTRPSTAPTSRPRSTPKPTKTPTQAPTAKPTKAPKPSSAPTKPASSTTGSTSPGGRICPAGQVWSPAPGTTWQWQLTGTIDTSIDVQMYDIDLFDNTAATIAKLHNDGRAVICYFSTQYENWRPDAASWPASVLGDALDDWPGEKYVDIRSDAVKAIMQSRLDLAVSKGCDGVEPDNVDEYTNKNGLGITAADQIAFNTFVATEARKRGLSVGLKNDLGQVKSLQPQYDWALNEQCNQYSECSSLSAFTKAGKAVFGVEYSGSASKFCPTMVTDKFSWLLKDLDLNAKVTQCCTYASGGCAAKAAHQCLSYNSKRNVLEPAEAIEELAEPVEAIAEPAEPVQEFAFASSASSVIPFVAGAFVAALALFL